MTLYKILAIAAVVLAILTAVGLEVVHLKNQGRDAERAAEAAVAQQHEQQMLQNSRDVDNEVAKDPDPDATLRKEWEQNSNVPK